MANITHTAGLNTSLSPLQSNISTQSHVVLDPSTQLGYGLGKIARGVLEAFARAWQSAWAQEPSEEALTARRQIAIYCKGLRKCVQEIDSALEHLRKNPHDPGALSKIEALAQQCVLYLAPDENGEQRTLQLKAFKPLEEKVAGITEPYLRRVLKDLLPFISIEKRALQQASGWPASFDLATLNGANGFVVPGIAPSGYLGLSVNTAGDLNGDGRADLVLGAPAASSYLGAVYVLFGQATGWPATFDLKALNGINGFAIPGIVSGSLGQSVSTAGDLNGDGKADLVLGAQSASSGLGAVYVLFGRATGWPASFDLTALNGTNGFVVPGISATGDLGYSVSTAGDMNGDGKADLVLGAYGVLSNRGSVYVLFGKAGGWPAVFNLTTLTGTNGFVVPGISGGDKLGFSVSTAGDMNGDGNADLVLGAPGVSSQAGSAYVLFGQTSGWAASFNLTTLNGTNGYVVPGAGSSVSTAGDANGDGKADLVLGASRVVPGGAAYVLFGKASGWPASFNLTTLNGTNGFAVPGIVAYSLGNSVNTAGDLNGDGKADLILGASSVSGSTGEAYVLFGQTSGWPASFNIMALNGTNGFAVAGLTPLGELGYSVSTAGDLNGDGIADLILGAYGVSSSAGAAYVLFGRNPSVVATTSPSSLTSMSSAIISFTPTSIVSPASTIMTTVVTPNVPSPPPPDPTLGIALGVASVIVVGGIIGTIVILRYKKKACFAEDSRPRVVDAQSVTEKAYA